MIIHASTSSSPEVPEGWGVKTNRRMDKEGRRRRVCVIGCGIAGLTTALYLAKVSFATLLSD
jgi:heterodisulfide reductase subunit A-like polyferredoxin